MAKIAARLPLVALLVLVACTTSEDPAEGGLFNGIAGLAGGGYEARIEEREASLAEAEARNVELSAELAALRRQHSGLKSDIIQKRATLRAKGIKLSAASEREVQEVIAAQPQSAAALRRAIADARALSEELTRLSG